MIHGTVVGLQARIKLLVRSETTFASEIEFVVDTGFEGFLTLPSLTIAELGFPFIAKIEANLADNSNVATNAYAARIGWNGVEREVIVLGMGLRPLLGTALLQDYHLGIDFCEDGTVLIDDIL